MAENGLVAKLPTFGRIPVKPLARPDLGCLALAEVRRTAWLEFGQARFSVSPSVPSRCALLSAQRQGHFQLLVIN